MITQKTPPGGLQASRYVSVHSQRLHDIGNPDEVQREGGVQPPARSTLKGQPALLKGPRG
jgi:hypothetical protein